MGEYNTHKDEKSNVALGYQHAGNKTDSPVDKESGHALAQDIVAFETAKRELTDAYNSFNKGVSLFIAALSKPNPNPTMIQDAQRIINESRDLIASKNSVYQSTKAKITTDLEQMEIKGKDTTELRAKIDLDPSDASIEKLRKKANSMECNRLNTEIDKHNILRSLRPPPKSTPSHGPATAT